MGISPKLDSKRGAVRLLQLMFVWCEEEREKERKFFEVMISSSRMFVDNKFALPHMNSSFGVCLGLRNEVIANAGGRLEGF